MFAGKLRQRLTYTAMSAFVVWHTFAMVIAPAPESDVTTLARKVLQPYLTVFRLDNQWDFFAPIVGQGSRLRYDILDRAGKTHVFMPAEELSWYHPSYLWFRSWYYRIMDNPDGYADGAAALLCHKHAALQPLAITLYEVQEEPYTREDYLAGKKRLDEGFFSINMLRGVPCPRSSNK